LAVPRSIAMSCDIHLNQRVQNMLNLFSALPVAAGNSPRHTIEN